MSPSFGYDVLVVGTGVAGLTAATRLAEEGARVCVIAKGVGSTHLAPGTIDALVPVSGKGSVKASGS